MIPRRPVTFRQVLPWLLAFICACGWAMATLGLWEQRAAARHFGATNVFLQTLLRHGGCVTRSAIIAAAEERGQSWQDVERPVHRWRDPDSLQDWLAVKIRPEFFLSTHDEGRYFFGFDTDGCVASGLD